jgi:threonine/homoserine/homoserine lactone efflux protein
VGAVEVAPVLQLFVWVAAAHFLALLSPGPDFFLVVRTALAGGWRRALWTCVGIAAANALFIAAALGGMSLLAPDSLLFRLLQVAGGLYLIHLGWASWRHAPAAALEPAGLGAFSGTGPAPVADRWRSLREGFVSGALNPKNALFYASLAALLGAEVTTGWRWLMGAWMVLAVLGWDSLVAAAAGHDRVRRRFGRWLPALTRGCGAVLLASGCAMVGAAGLRR